MPDPKTLEMIRGRFENAHAAILATTDARSEDRLEFLEKAIEKRKQGEINDITTLLDELESGIKKDIEDSTKLVQQELGLWPENERLQLKRDIDAIRARLARIPSERANEKKVIDLRYANLTSRTFPVAVTFILPPQ